MMSSLEGSSSDPWSGSGAVLDNITGMENLTLSCAARNIHNPVEQQPYSETVLTTVKVFQSTFFLLFVLLIGSFLNGFVIVLIVKYKKLHTITFGIALQVVIAHLFGSLLTGSISFISSVANRWIFGKYVCALIGVIYIFFFFTRATLMLVFVFDRFLSVFFPFGYPKYQKKVVIILSASAWAFSLMVGAIGAILDCYTFVSKFWFCYFSGACNSRCITYSSVLFIAFGVPVTVVPVILYALLFIKAKKAKKAILSETAAFHDKYKKDRKATITFFLLFVTTFALVLPGFIISTLLQFLFQGEQEPAILYVFSVFIGNLLALILFTDPIVILKNPDVRAVFKEINSSLKKKFNLKIKPTEREEIELKTRKTVK